MSTPRYTHKWNARYNHRTKAAEKITADDVADAIRHKLDRCDDDGGALERLEEKIDKITSILSAVTMMLPQDKQDEIADLCGFEVMK